jgi:hypothetical protein
MAITYLNESSSNAKRNACDESSRRRSPLGGRLYNHDKRLYDREKGEQEMLWKIVSASIVTALVSLICIIAIPYSIAPKKWGTKILTGFKTPFAFLLSGHIVIFMLATLVGLLVGSIILFSGMVPKSFFWIVAVVALIASLAELVTDLGWWAEKVMGTRPQRPKKIIAEKATMLLGAVIGIGIWFLIVHAW